jgi:sugar lactone lactonase YvrE
MLDEAGKLEPFARLDADSDLVRLSIAKCDSQGRLWAGTLAIDLRPGCGALYRIDPDGSVTPILRDLSLSHGLDWSPDGSTLYYIDSPTRWVEAFDFDTVRGGISNRRTIVTVNRDEGLPDGMTVDQQGCLWVAIMGAGQVRRYSPDGAPLACVQTSAPAVTNCAFGGADGADLFITSAAARLPYSLLNFGFSAEFLEKSHSAPGAGGVFVCRPAAMGKPATPFAG